MRNKKEKFLIDLTLSSSSDEGESETETEAEIADLKSENEIKIKCPFYPPLNISGNVLGPRHLKILETPSAWFNDDLVNAYFYK